MTRYDPERMELSTRDRVALAAYTEIKEGRGTPNGGVWLDVSHLPRETIMDRLPRVYQTLMELQMLDITTHADRDRADRALLDGRRLGAPRGPQHRRRRPVRDRRSVQRAARRQPARRQLADRAARLRQDRRPKRPPRTRLSSTPNNVPREAVADGRDEVDGLLGHRRPGERPRPATSSTRHDDRARRRRTRRGRTAQRALRELADIEERMTRCRRPPRHRRLPGPRPRLRPESQRAGGARHARGSARTPRDPRLPQPLRLPGARRMAPGQPGVVRPRPIEHEAIPGIPLDISARMREVSSHGKLVE